MATRYLAFLIASTTLCAVAPVNAQTRDQTVAELKAQIEALSRRVNELERSRSSAEPTTAAQAGSPSVTTADLPAADQNASTSAAVISAKVASAPIDRSMQKPGSAVQLTATSEGGEVAIRIGKTIENASLREGQGRASTQTISLTASAPIAEGATRSDIGTLDGFSNGAKLTFRWSRFQTSFRTPRSNANQAIKRRYDRIVAKARGNCLARNRLDQNALQACQDEINSGFIDDNAPELLNDFDRLYQPRADLAYGLEASIGYDELGYFDGSTLEEKSVKRVPLGAKGFVTLFPNASLTSLTASFAYQRIWKDQDSAILCPATTPPAPVECIEGPIGSPNLKTKLLGALELRKQWNLNSSLLPTFAIAPQLTYDFKAENFGVDVPIYIVPDGDGNLLGGLRFGYRSADKDFAVGVFVGTAFSLDN